MPLKDLIASAASVNEDVIEKIVGDFVRYDVSGRVLVLTPSASCLSGRNKVLVYLTANEGWCYVDEGVSRSATSPKDLEVPLSLRGGSLRPALAALQKDNLIRKDGRGYRIVSAQLSKISEIVAV